MTAAGHAVHKRCVTVRNVCAAFPFWSWSQTHPRTAITYISLSFNEEKWVYGRWRNKRLCFWIFPAWESTSSHAGLSLCQCVCVWVCVWWASGWGLNLGLQLFVATWDMRAGWRFGLSPSHRMYLSKFQQQKLTQASLSAGLCVQATPPDTRTRTFSFLSFPAQLHGDVKASWWIFSPVKLRCCWYQCTHTVTTSIDPTCLLKGLHGPPWKTASLTHIYHSCS